MQRRRVVRQSVILEATDSPQPKEQSRGRTRAARLLELRDQMLSCTRIELILKNKIVSASVSCLSLLTEAVLHAAQAYCFATNLDAEIAN